MQHCDRLEALIRRFEMRVTPAPVEEANLAVLGCPGSGAPRGVVFAPRAEARCPSGEPILAAARAEWGGAANPLLAALPERICYDARGDEDMMLLLELFRREVGAGRCGSRPVLSRLGEVLVIKLLRIEIERGATSRGLIAGLADPQLARAIVAMHEEPGRAWRNEDLAELAGMSLSRFMEAFRQTVGETPQGYLRRWRMTLARQEIERGARVQAVARRYGYTSPEALSRAFVRAFGVSPRALRRRAA